MIRTIVMTALFGATGLGGWLAGSIYPAPPEWTDAINRQANDLRAKLRLETISLAGFRELIPAAKFDELKTELNDIALAAGEMIMVERDSGTLEEQLDNLAMTEESALPDGLEVIEVASPSPVPGPEAAPPPPPGVPPDANASDEEKRRFEAEQMERQQAEAAAAAAPAPAPAGETTSVVVMSPVSDNPKEIFSSKLSMCPRMTVTNAPAHDGLNITAYKRLVDVQGVRIATFPTPGACLSSGFGPRNDRLHKGIDYHSDTGVPVLAGGDGAIVEMKFRDDYGNMIVIDHGGGVYTRYAHLASFGRGLSVGVTLKQGEQIGLMGNSASYQIPIHLHYELLTGNYNTPKGSFGLEAVNPFSFPEVR